MPPLTLHDSMSRQMREVTPLDGRCYRFYCCGPTVYGPAHIGNFRTFVIQDIFRRVLECSGMETRHVRNVTDVDDKTIRESRAQGVSLQEFTRRWRAKFTADCEALNILAPHVEPGAVDHIAHQVRMIESLKEKGHAYQTDEGSVYFDVASFPRYGRLSRVGQRELKLRAGRALNDADEYGKDALADFALWKSRKTADGDNHWPSPWGEGRPGWHLECSAMSLAYLGETFDMHSGGVDLIFPHHENEIAQSECCSGATLAHHWFHISHLLVDGGKMSKRRGNFYTLDDLIELGFTAAELRYVYLSGHYRHPLNFTLDSLQGARQAMGRLAKFEHALAKRARAGPAAAGETPQPGHAGPFQPALEALAKDLNTPDALGRIFAAMKSIEPASLSGAEAAAQQQQFRFIIFALGLVLPSVDDGELELTVPGDIRALAEARLSARQSKDWPASDAMRDRLAEAGWLVQDGKDGYRLTPKS